MIYKIENEVLSVEIDSLGGELMSVKTKADDCEYLWQGDAAYWKGRAILLFPICGRLFEGKYTYDHVTYEMNSHGFIRACEMQVENQTADRITFMLSDSEETRKQYPFAFCYRVEYKLEQDQIIVGFKVENTDEKTLIFTLGGHPGFQVPLENGLTFDDYYVDFPENHDAERIDFSPTCFLTGKTIPYAMANNKVDLHHDLFDDDAIFLENMGTKAILGSQKGSKGVEIICKDMKYFGIWHTPKSDAPFVCMEPWLGIPSYDGKVDDFTTKRDMIHLPVGETFTTDFTIRVF
jgi:galactose mutarotase-like enzyme